MSLQNPRCVFQLLKQHVAPYTPEMVEKITGTPQDKFATVCEMGRLDRQRRAVDDDHVRARLDAAFQRFAEHPHRGDDPAPARQHRRARRRHQRAARALQRAGHHRHRHADGQHPRLHGDADRRRADAGGASGQADVHATSGKPDQLLAELQEVLRQLPEEHVRRQGDAGERVRLRLAAQGRHRLRRPEDVRRHAPGQDHRADLPGVQPADVDRLQGQDRGGAGEAQVPGQLRPDRDRHGALLGEPRRVQRRRHRQRSRPRSSCCRSPRSSRRRARSPIPAG